MYSITTGETRASTTPRIFFSRSRLGCTDFVYASVEEKSGFQYCLRFSTEAANSRIRYLSMPSTICAARSPWRVSGFVSGNGSAPSEVKDKMDRITAKSLCRQYMKLPHVDTSGERKQRQANVPCVLGSLGFCAVAPYTQQPKEEGRPEQSTTQTARQQQPAGEHVLSQGGQGRQTEQHVSNCQGRSNQNRHDRTIF